ncbi:MAG TPA: helix-turn-helix transcriptional regulator [Pseudomonas sp.]|nr:helix-turn-helix transcriptional regulator [Pseudomonas sp.]
MTYSESEHSNSGQDAVPFPISGIGTRVAAIADLYESRKEAAATAGVSLSTLQRWIAGDGMPLFDSLARLAMAKGVLLEWVATGNGSMLSGAAAEGARSEAGDDYAFIPLYDARCSAGQGAWNEHCCVLAKLAFTRYSLRRKGLEPSNLSAVRVTGDSMEPLLSDGDTIMLDHSRNALEGEGVYVILLDDHLYAKRLQRQFDGSVSIISQNKEYQAMTVPKERLDELQIIGRAVWSGGWMI